MVPRRIIAISPDKVFGDALATALQDACDVVEVHQTLEAVPASDSAASLYVVHLVGKLTDVPRMTLTCPVIVVLQTSNLEALVDLMQLSPCIAGMLVAEDLDSSQLTAMVSRLLADDVFGLDKLMTPGTQVHYSVVLDYQDKVGCMAAVSAFVEEAGVPRKYRESIEQCLDEMLMNGLYDAPVDAQGAHIFAGIPTKTRITMRSEQSVIVQFAYDGKQFAMSVRDAFGSLERATVLRHLYKGLHSKHQVDRKAGGAGLGLYLMANTSTALYFHVLPGVATEAVCVFAVDQANVELEQFGFFVQHDAAGQKSTGPARRLSAGPSRLWRWLAAGAVAAALAVVAVVLWPRAPAPAHVTFTTVPPGALIEIDGRVVGRSIDLVAGRRYPVVARLDGYEPLRAELVPHGGDNDVSYALEALARVELDSRPSSAAVEIEGKPMGSTPLTLTSLAPSSTVTVVFRRTGYRDARAQVHVPARGGVERVSQVLELSDQFVRVHFVSTPAGAEVIRTGDQVTTDRTFTPADVFVEVGKLQRFTLTMPRHVPMMIEPFTPTVGEQGLEKGGRLIEGAALHVKASVAGRVSVSPAPHCQALAVPADCTLGPGSYVVEFETADHQKQARSIALVGREQTVTF